MCQESMTQFSYMQPEESGCTSLPHCSLMASWIASPLSPRRRRHALCSLNTVQTEIPSLLQDRLQMSKHILISARASDSAS